LILKKQHKHILIIALYLVFVFAGLLGYGLLVAPRSEGKVEPRVLETTMISMNSAKRFQYDEKTILVKDALVSRVQSLAKESVTRSIAKTGYSVMTVPEGKEVGQFIYDLQKSGIEVEPNLKFSVLATNPNDPLFTANSSDTSKQWNLPKIKAPQAWDVSTGSPSIKIAILDTGVRLTHEDLASKLTAASDWYDFVNSDADPTDDHGHGTWVSGIAAAATNNSQGIAGVDWLAKIMPLKVLDEEGSGLASDVGAAITWAADKGAQVINMSFGAYGINPGDFGTGPIEAAITYAHDTKGVALFAASGNEAACTIASCGFDYTPGTVDYPANHPKVFAVGSADFSDTRSSFSNYGPTLDLLAPGVAIWGPHFYMDSAYVQSSGT